MGWLGSGSQVSIIRSFPRDFLTQPQHLAFPFSLVMCKTSEFSLNHHHTLPFHQFRLCVTPSCIVWARKDFKNLGPFWRAERNIIILWGRFKFSSFCQNSQSFPCTAKTFFGQFDRWGWSTKKRLSTSRSVGILGRSRQRQRIKGEINKRWTL